MKVPRLYEVWKYPKALRLFQGLIEFGHLTCENLKTFGGKLILVVLGAAAELGSLRVGVGSYIRREYIENTVHHGERLWLF